jgi:PAS domain S-box-containing protein
MSAAHRPPVAGGSLEKRETMRQYKDESRLRVVVETAVDGVILIDAQGRIEMFNPACEKLFGYSADEVIGRNVKMLMPSPYRDEHDRYLENFHTTGERKIIGLGREVTGQRKDGSIFPMNLSVGEAKQDGKSVFVGIIHDLSERRRAARVITEALASIRAVVDTVVDGVIMIDAQGTVQMFNPACEKLFGYAAHEVIGRNVKMLMPSPYCDEHDGYIENYRRTGEKKIIGLGREVSGRRKDGTTFPMDLSVGEAMQDSGSIFVGIIRDLTEHKRAEQEIRETAARLKALVDTAVDGVIMIDAQGTVQMFNPACEKLFGYAADEAIGQNVKMLMPSPYRDEHDRYLENFHRTGERRIIGIGREVTGQRKDGTTFPMDLSVGEAKRDGGSNFVGIIHDLTERKHTEAQLVQAQKMETVGQLSGGIAHDFNNLLTVVVGNAEILSDMLKARPDMKTLADAIVQAGERGAELTQRLLAFGRRQTLRPEKIDCNALVRAMEKLLRRMLSEAIEIRSALEDSLWTAYADAGQLENAILNLAINARDAMEGSGTLTVTTANVPLDARYRDLHPEVNPGDYVMVAVTDDGHGMPREVLEHVFEPFFTTKEVGRGSGLGLSMVYGFVKQSNGHVAIYSEPGLGTTVRIYLPALTSAADRVPSLVPAEPAPVPGREAVLVAEDDPFVRSFAVTCLSSLGYRVIEAVDGREALQRLQDGAEADILFTDVVMPGGINGWELAERAREIRPGLKVLLTSGYALETLAERGRLPAGAIVLNKPYRKAELARRLREAVASPA